MSVNPKNQSKISSGICSICLHPISVHRVIGDCTVYFVKNNDGVFTEKKCPCKIEVNKPSTIS